jgi:hypothetical protein
MPDPIEDYLDQVMREASLSRADQRRVRAELREHLHEMLESQKSQLNPTEAFAMMSNQFGDPTFLGKAMASAKGRFRTYLKKKARRVPIGIAIVVVLTLAIRAKVAEAFYVPGDSVSPVVPRGSRCLVNKLASDFRAGDVIVYWSSEAPGHRYLAIVKSSAEGSDELVITRNNRPAINIPRSSIVGRVFLNTR